MSTIWIYEKAAVLRVFDSEAEAREWLADNDPSGAALQPAAARVGP
jgi:hypothetical protein